MIPNAGYFGGSIDAKITWGRRKRTSEPARLHKSLTMGSVFRRRSFDSDSSDARSSRTCSGYRRAGLSITKCCTKSTASLERGDGGSSILRRLSPKSVCSMSTSALIVSNANIPTACCCTDGAAAKRLEALRVSRHHRNNMARWPTIAAPRRNLAWVAFLWHSP